jgi:hypothetical protein
MKEIKPTYITFEQAKWLKEKGFKIGSNRGYLPNGELSYSQYASLCYNDEEDYPTRYSAPEQWQVVEWLRVNHGIWVESLHRGDMGDFIFKVVELNENNWKKHPHYIHNEGFNSPQEAYSAAFDYIKDNNLI